MGLYEFFDDVNRSQIIVNTDSLLSGAYSGMMDTSKIKKSAFNWMREIGESPVFFIMYKTKINF